jgi:hypothetical protein
MRKTFVRYAVRLFGVFVVTSLCATPGLAAGQDGRLLPDFRVTAADGRDVAGSALSAEGQWLLIYVSPDSPPSHQLLQALQAWQSPQLIARTVIVVRGDAATAQRYIEKRLPAELKGIAWFADSKEQAWNALSLQGTPVLIGIAKGQVRWVVAGVLNDANALESVVRTWVEAPPQTGGQQ